ncbi:hypothetical protein CDAR_251451 [Caerostris darwini]|uniref:Uncharacterized protein n=1 Tax=Caerostris darwini TaxID=1538125 RepID=A0AAV4MD08_9ARAC|nr:hypothetical protein CDAR_251451 [Caerostris darwini]
MIVFNCARDESHADDSISESSTHTSLLSLIYKQLMYALSVARMNSPGLRLRRSQRIAPNLVSTRKIYAGLCVSLLVSTFSPLYKSEEQYIISATGSAIQSFQSKKNVVQKPHIVDVECVVCVMSLIMSFEISLYPEFH